jgi:hypothetical protein
MNSSDSNEIYIVNRDRFDYAKRREILFENLYLEEIIQQGNAYSQSIQNKEIK